MLSVQNAKLHKLATKNIIFAIVFIFIYSINMNPAISHGIYNCGNSCYFNSSIQLLAHITPLTKLLDEKATNKDNKFLTKFYINFINDLYKTNIEKEKSEDFYTITLQNFINDKYEQIFTIGHQEDAGEFLSFIIDYLRNSYNPNIEILEKQIEKNPNDPNLQDRLKTASEDFDNIIWPRTITESICGLCNETTIKEESLNILSLEITPKKSLQDSLDTFFQETETRDDKNICEHKGEKKYYFPEDNKQEFAQIKNRYPNLIINPTTAPFKRRFYFLYVSDYLIIQLKRFKYINHVTNKIKHHVTFPLNLDLKKYCKNKQASQLYKLSSIIYHHGSTPHSGHYWAYAQGEDGQWRQFNDDTVSNYTDEQIMQLSKQQVNNGTPYIFLYKRDNKTSGEAHPKPSLTPEEQVVQAESLKDQLEMLHEILKTLNKSLETLRGQLTTLKEKLTYKRTTDSSTTSENPNDPNR